MSTPQATDVTLNDLTPNDILIAFMGPTGSGKSTIIDALTDSEERGGSELESCTQTISATRVLNHPTYGDRLILVDTPGFDDIRRSDRAILEMIADWLRDTYDREIPIAGLIYLHRIKDTRMSGTPHKNLRMFGKLCGENAAKKVLLATTTWDITPPNVAEGRENQLIDMFWDVMIQKGAHTGRFYNTRDSAWFLVDAVLKETTAEMLLIQEELCILKRRLNETSAGKELYLTLQRLLCDHREAISKLSTQVKDNHGPQRNGELQMRLKRTQRELDETVRKLRPMEIPFLRKIILLCSRPAEGRAIAFTTGS